MSVFRFLSPTRSVGSGSSSPSRRRDEIRVRLHVPSYGTVFMPYPAISPGEPRTDHEFRGDLEVEVPRGWGRVKCRAIRVGLKTISILDMGPNRGIEEDTIFERKAEIRGGTVDGIMLEEGLHYFDWTLILPSTLAPHDWHPGARVKHILYGEVEGIPDVSFASNFLRRTSFASTSSTPSRSRSNSPPLFSPGASLSILRQDVALPQPPTYNYSEYGTDDVEWLRGTAYGERTIMLLFNPDPAGGVSSLDMRVNGGAEGIGPFDIRFLSDVWTVCASLHAKITLASPSPDATIYHIRIGLAQKARITSPRDDPATTKPIVIERFFPILAHGDTPPPGRSTGERMAPIWKHGEGGDELIFNGQGRLPDDTLGRPSTLEGNETPIQVSHRLVTEVWFSVYGEDQFGKPLKQPGPGELRVLRIEKPVIVPTCFLIPSVLNLPLCKFFVHLMSSASLLCVY
ncbi:hypothetical protein BCR39DRAFT_539659 [Naematelia encephala]|uniref:Arrestin-like N-terminal domain-containing protein n=1 Tax=Naematelia encephala TaxID=71784 RepID=A0A1Y2AXP4_9TREE|nr:hypothetical protein BCR39DRAFT_539659 [Naematelia encephala]